MSAVVSAKVCFSSKRGDEKWWAKIVAVEFNKVQSSLSEQHQLQKHTSVSQSFAWSDVLHAVAGVCSVCLPDMEVPAIYNSLTGPGCKTVVILAMPSEVLSHRTHKSTVTKATDIKATPPSASDTSFAEEEEEDSPFSGVISDDGGTEGETDEEEEVEDGFAKEREEFLTQAKHRKTTDQHSLESVGSEHCILGCASLQALSSTTGKKKAVQVSLLAVRRRCRGLGLGRQLMQCLKDPEVVGQYDSLLAFVDHKAEGFFIRHGFSDDPMLTARYRRVVEHWENSTLMAYVPPFSSGGLAVGSLKSLAHFQEHYKTWRESAISMYSVELEMMERLKHELLLLHTKIQSQEEVINELSQQVTGLKLEKLTIEREFTEYRKHTQKLLCEAAVDSAEKWIKTNS